MIPLQGAQEFSLPRLSCTTPQFRENYRGGPDERGHSVDSLLITASAELVD